MCGISGIINRPNKQVTEQQIKKMNDLIKHRGPDDEGYFFKNSFALAHRRLSILDLSSDGHQPMHYMEKYTITYNGEVYNYVEIKEELEKEGYHFFSSTDTEVILASYDKWGVDCVDKFNGMWAFALFDKEKNIIFCSRDRFGIKPFYYTEVNQQFLFGSEIKQLLEAHDSNYVNTKVLSDYLVTRMQEHTNETFFEKIYKLPASHNLIYDLENHQYEIKRYYSIEIDPKISDVGEENAIKSYREELQRAIALRLRSDVKVGTCLSGGMDSSSVASIASKLYRAAGKNRFTAITAVSTEKENDESAYAKEVADYALLDWQTLQPSREDFLQAVDDVVYTQ
jgi:asparagine synthase (glutamine-hydrolysing)